MTHVWAVILGVLQGFAEFLPISSTAHLKLVPWIFGVRDPMLSSTQFDIALHAGSLIAIVIALWRDWVDLVVAALGGAPKRVSNASHPDAALRETGFARRYLGFLLLTSFPGGALGVMFADKLEYLSTPDVAGHVASGIDAATFHYAPVLLGVMLIVFGVALWASDRFVTKAEPLEAMTWWRAFLIGLAEACRDRGRP